MKQCTECKELKPFEQFNKGKAFKDGLQYKCKACLKAYCQRRHLANREQYLVRMKAWRETGTNMQDALLKSRYGLTREQLDAMREAQQYRCAWCKLHEDTLTRGLFVDHNHETGEVRRLLCIRCNLAEGLLKDWPGAVEALERHAESIETL